jgi:hypothetical protein
MAEGQTNYIRRKGTTPNTSTVISSKVKVYAGTNTTEQIGVIANFDPSESRSAEPVRGIGFGDQIAELVPGMTDAISISVGRTAQYLQNLYQAFGYRGGVEGIVRSLKHHRWPFDIRQEIVVSWLVNDSVADNEFTGASTDAHDIGAETADTAIVASDTPGSFSRTVATATTTAPAGNTTELRAVRTIYEGCWFTDWSTSYTSDTTIVQESGTIMCTDVYDEGHSELSKDLQYTSLAGGASLVRGIEQQP